MDELMRRIRAAADAFTGEGPREFNTRRRPTEKEWQGWDTALTARARTASPSTVSEVQAKIKHRNPIRWHNLQRDFRWVQKEMKKMGLNPEDARYIL